MSKLPRPTYSELHPKKQKKKQLKQQLIAINDKTYQGYDGEQPCPGGCGFGISKTGGCNYIKCIVCKSEWCWLCHKLKGKNNLDKDSSNEYCTDKSHNSHS